MMNRTDRLFAIAEELRAAGQEGLTSEALAERFEISTRTVKRDIAALAEAGLPVWSEGGPGGGYRLLTSTRPLPPVEFTDLEATAVALALAEHGDSPFAPEARSALTKILRSMPDGSRARADELAARIWRLDSRPRHRFARELDEAVRNRLVVRIDYDDAEGAQSRRRPVEPMAYAQLDGAWYLLAWCRWREGGRWFRLDRVQRCVLTHETAPERDLEATFGQVPPEARPLRLGS